MLKCQLVLKCLQVCKSSVEVLKSSVKVWKSSVEVLCPGEKALSASTHARPQDKKSVGAQTDFISQL